MPANESAKAPNAEILATVQEIKSILTGGRSAFEKYFPYLRGPTADPAPPYGMFRGPIADPGPEFRRFGYDAVALMRGPVADPGPELLLDRKRLIQLALKKIEIQVGDLERQLDLARTQQGLLQEELKASA